MHWLGLLSHLIQDRSSAWRALLLLLLVHILRRLQLGALVRRRCSISRLPTIERWHVQLYGVSWSNLLSLVKRTRGLTMKTSLGWWAGPRLMLHQWRWRADSSLVGKHR